MVQKSRRRVSILSFLVHPHCAEISGKFTRGTHVSIIYTDDSGMVAGATKAVRWKAGVERVGVVVAIIF